MRSCVLHENTGSGVFSLFNKVITYMETYDVVEVRFNPKNTPYKINVDNLWDVISNRNELCPTQAFHTDEYNSTYSCTHAARWYLRENGWRERLNKILQRVVFVPKIGEIINNEITIDLSNCIAIQHRSSESIIREQLFQKAIPPDDFIRCCNKIDKHCPVLVACDSKKAYDEFKSSLGDRMITFQSLGWSEIGGEMHFEQECGIDHVQGMIAQTLALSRCKHFIHAVSNIATAALYMNPEMTHTFLQG